jgi:dihydrofolate reductase
MKISLIVAMARNHAIGLNGQMPWHLSEDLKRFRRLTLGSPIVMGRKTFEAIGRPLPGRTNIVISRNSNFKADGCLVFTDIDQALAAVAEAPQVFIIGGATIYEAMLHRANYLFLTLIDQDFEGDTFFPTINTSDWQETERRDVIDDDSVDFVYSFITFENRHPLNSTA